MNQIACHECDLLLTTPLIKEGQRANCPRCNHLLFSKPRHGMQRALAYAIAALLFLFLANIFPFLTFQAKGNEQTMTLLQSSLELYRYGRYFLASFVMMFIILAPALLLFCIISVLGPIVSSKKLAFGSYWLGHLIFQTSPWCMAEVFLIGVLVSVIKIAGLATVIIGISFWAYVGFTIFLTMSLMCLDKHEFWDALDSVNQ